MFKKVLYYFLAGIIFYVRTPLLTDFRLNASRFLTSLVNLEEL